MEIVDVKFKDEKYVFHYRVAGVIEKEGKYLVQQISGKDYYILPGGHVHIGETSIDAIRREIREEVGIEVEEKDCKLFCYNENIFKRDDKIEKATITKIEVYQGLNKVTVEEGQAGDIITLSGINNINIGETICDENAIEKIDFVDIDEPTVSMTFSVNNGPFAGKEGKFITSRHLRDRLMKEMERNISLRVKETEFPDSFEVAGRGELHLTVLIENMRRFELIVSRPKVIMKEINGVLSEPIEKVVIDAPSETIGSVIEKMGRRKGEMIDMKPGEGDFTRVEFLIPARRTYRI